MIDNVIEWLKTLDVVVHLAADIESNQYCPSERRVSIKIIKNKQHQLFSLLHEAGHVILQHNEDFHQEMYPHKHHNDPEISLWLADLLQEEYDAWQEGFLLSEKLGLSIDFEKYEQYADECLNSYRGFATSVDKFANKIITTSDEEFKSIFQYFLPMMK